MNKISELAEICAYRRRRFIETKTNLEIKPCFFHGCFIISHKRFENILSYGENISDLKLDKTIHAEHKAIINLPCLKRKKNLKKVDIIVVRTTKSGTLGLSKPCYHCLIAMNTLIKEKGYIIEDIYYTNSDGNLERTDLNKLLHDENCHVTKYYRTKVPEYRKKLKLN